VWTAWANGIEWNLWLMNQHQLDTLFLVCLLRVNAFTCFGRYASIFRGGCTVAIWCNCVRSMCVDCVQVAPNANCTRSTPILHTQLHQIATVQSLLKMGEQCPKHVEALTLNKQTKKSVSSWCWFINVPWCTVNKTSNSYSVLLQRFTCT
jgi:hypothetical protein